MAQLTVWKYKFSPSRSTLVKERKLLRDAGIPCGTIFLVVGGYRFKHWHSGPKVNMR